MTTPICGYRWLRLLLNRLVKWRRPLPAMKSRSTLGTNHFFCRLVVLGAAVFCTQLALAQSEHDNEPISYSSSTPTDRVSRLAAAVEDGSATVEWDARHGWLKSLLRHFGVSSSSQTLVFSKTSMQFRRITPRYPRALYFNDDVYVGWVHGGDVVELGTVDPQLGAVFYSVSQKESNRPVFKRDRGECMACHENRRTQDVPGFLVRSVFPLADGQPDFRRGTLTTDHTTPFKDRFGGWYVTGSHGEMRHRGNELVSDEDDGLDKDSGANLSELPPQVQVGKYLETGSDLVALMVLEHQSQLHNLVTNAGYTCRKAMFQQNQMNQILDRPEGYRSDSTDRRINNSAEKLVRYLFFSDEFPLSSPVRGTSEFAKEFTARGVRDSQGRSLRDLDLKTRLLRYPCSYLIYSESFLALPTLVLERVRMRMLDILAGEDQTDQFSHLSAKDRQNIMGILSETHPLFAGPDIGR